MMLCCTFHLTGGNSIMPCCDTDCGKIIIGEPLGPADDDENDEEQADKLEQMR
jgi:hypothetical protein